jgi:hypothetical protein
LGDFSLTHLVTLPQSKRAARIGRFEKKILSNAFVVIASANGTEDAGSNPARV